MMERLLERLSLSVFRKNFIIKGGFLIAAIVGLGSRGTMDLDVTAKDFLLTHDSITEAFNVISAIELEDDIAFSISKTTDIREGDDYPGLRVHLLAKYPPLNVPLTVDVTTGDRITPSEIEYSFRLLYSFFIWQPCHAFNIHIRLTIIQPAYYLTALHILLTACITSFQPMPSAYESL